MAVRVLAPLLAFIACAALLLLLPPGAAEDSGWRQPVNRLAHEKALAEGCASILKTFGDDAPMARVQGERLYARAKADMDGVVALLILNLAAGRSPAETPELRQRLEVVPAQRRALCRHVDAAVGMGIRQEAGGTRLADLLAEGSADAASSAIDAAVQIWQEYRRADQAGRAAIISGMEAARWLDYAEVPGA